MDERRMGFMEHLGELRNRLVRAVLFALAAAIGCFFAAAHIINFLKFELLPPAHMKLHSFTLGEPLFQEIKVAIVCGLGLTVPYLVYQIWAFVAPGLYTHERKIVMPLILAAILFFLAGGSFCFFVVLPFAVDFLATYGAEHTEVVLQLSAFISFVLFFMLSFGLIFELPVVLYFLARVGVVRSAPLRKFRRYAILGAFVVAAILTPTPDVVNQCLMAVPIWALYELGIVGVAHVERDRAARAAAERAAEAKARAAEATVAQPGDGGT
jgi:sec-independent protein translocase protein TatC